MFYSKPTKNNDGLYFVKAYTDDKKKIFLQVKGDAKHDDGEVHFRLADDASKIQAIDDENIEAAKLNAMEWFGKKVGDATLERAYTKSLSDSQVTTDVIKATKIFDSGKQIVEVDTLGEWAGCTGLVEFAGLWFAKKAFGPTWNIVQVRVHDDPILDTYPEEYAFVDEDDQ